MITFFVPLLYELWM